MKYWLASLFLVGASCAVAAGAVLGTVPPEWTVSDWVNSAPLSLAGLRGRAVLVRWWTGPECAYCTESAEALNGWWEKYRGRGLVVVGMYHHKSATRLMREHVETQARRLHFKFPIGIDRDWVTLKRWWLAGRDRAWTSVTFLLNGNGTVRHVHPGGSYVKGAPDYERLEQAIEEALPRR